MRPAYPMHFYGGVGRASWLHPKLVPLHQKPVFFNPFRYASTWSLRTTHLVPLSVFPSSTFTCPPLVSYEVCVVWRKHKQGKGQIVQRYRAHLLHCQLLRLLTPQILSVLPIDEPKGAESPFHVIHYAGAHRSIAASGWCKIKNFHHVDQKNQHQGDGQKTTLGGWPKSSDPYPGCPPPPGHSCIRRANFFQNTKVTAHCSNDEGLLPKHQ